MASSVTLQALGLNTSQNQLMAPEGSLLVASNVIIRRSGVIESRRGLKLYGDAMGTSSTRASQIISYKNRILRQYDTTLQFDNGSGTFSSFSGSYSPAQSGLRTKSTESNGNLFFTTSQGVKKISASTAADLSTSASYITQSGGIKALDITGELNTTPVGTAWFLSDSTVAYRILWGVKDLNNNLILGSPSERFVIYNYQQDVIVRNYLSLLNALDNVGYTGLSLISNTNYMSTGLVSFSDTLTTIRAKMIDTALKIDNDLLLADIAGPAPLDFTGATYDITSNIATITFASTNPSTYLVAGDKFFLAAIDANLNNGGTNPAFFEVSSVTPTTIVFNYIHANVLSTGITSGTMNSYKYRGITQPTAPSDPVVHDDLAGVTTYLSNIIAALQGEPNSIIPTATKAAYIDTLEISAGYTVDLNITVPEDVTTTHFYQIYRSQLLTAVGTDVISEFTPSDELRLVYEASPTSAEITAGAVLIEDVTPDAFAGANLYTNPSSGEGILQANDVPPFALDINRFKDYTFYANTRTKYRLPLQLLSVANMIEQYNGGDTPTITIADGTVSNTYTFVTGIAEVTPITIVNTKAAFGSASYFTLYSANDEKSYYVWFDKSGTDTDPAVANHIGIRIDISSASITTATHIATRLTDILTAYVDDFSVVQVGPLVTTTNNSYGATTNSVASNGDITIGAITQGRGETGTQVLLSNLPSPAQAVDETIRSLVRLINKNTNELAYAFNISSQEDLPGKIYLESRVLNTAAFYVLADSADTGISWSPDIGPTLVISAIGTGAIPTITTTTNHGMVTGSYVVISGTNSTPSVDGRYLITSTGLTTFTIIKTVTIVGTYGGAAKQSDTLIAENEEKANRIYYSKYQQPEAVPILNYFDVGSKDKAIRRILPLRDSLFVFKDDGVFRVAGEVSPFTVSLFDGTAKLIASDSIDATNNQLIGWFDQGINVVTESGVSLISRSIDIDLIRVRTYANFETATFGIGYDSDSSYTVFTPSNDTDVYASQAYRYSTLTQSWTTFDHGATCGLIHNADDKIYIGAEDQNSLEIERKSFSRLDYADREFSKSIDALTYSGNIISFSSVVDFAMGDVITQDQYVTIFKYNMLLKKLDNDTTLADSNYYSSIQALNGNNMSAKMDTLIAKIRDDAGRQSIVGHTANATYSALIPTPSSFTGQQTTWNSLMTILNADLGISYSDFQNITATTRFETIVSAVNSITKKVTIKDNQQFIQGAITLFKAIHTDITWTAQTMGDPLSLKQIYQATAMLEARAFTNVDMAFATDLLPQFESVTFTGDSSGAFGVSNPFGDNYFGGVSNSAPLRTIIPLNKQRCRYMVVKYAHATAFEQYAMLGITLTGNVSSTKGYR